MKRFVHEATLSRNGSRVKMINELLKRIQEVSKRALSIEVKHAGNLGYLQEIEESARDLVPIMVKYPQGKLPQEIRHIARNVLQEQ